MPCASCSVRKWLPLKAMTGRNRYANKILHFHGCRCATSNCTEVLPGNNTSHALIMENK